MGLVTLLGKVGMGLIAAFGQSNRTLEPPSAHGVCLGFFSAPQFLLLPHPPRCRFAQSRSDKGKSQRMLLPLALSLGSPHFQELSSDISARFATTSFLQTPGPLESAGSGGREALIKSGGSVPFFSRETRWFLFHL